MSLIFLGADPGISGAVVAISGDGRSLIDVCDMPTVNGYVDGKALADWCRQVEQCGQVELGTIEFVRSMPNQGVSSTFKFGSAWGVLHGVFPARGYDVAEAQPQTWKPAMGIDCVEIEVKKDRVRAQKRAALAKCRERWPAHADWFARVKDSGRADAALIGEWGRLMHSLRPGASESATVVGGYEH